jgi:hypothetical protein
MLATPFCKLTKQQVLLSMSVTVRWARNATSATGNAVTQGIAPNRKSSHTIATTRIAADDGIQKLYDEQVTSYDVWE